MSETILQQLASDQVSPEIPVNENSESMGVFAMYGRFPPASAGLVWAMYGGAWDGATIGTAWGSAPATNSLFVTVTLTASSTNYVVANRSTGAVTTSTATTNWDNKVAYGRIAKLTTNTTSVTAKEDWRVMTGGVFDRQASTAPFDLAAFYPGIPVTSAIVLRVPVARAIDYLANFAGSYGKASAAATASTAFDIQKNGGSVGTITFAAAASTATFVSAGGAPQSLAAGDVISIVAPGAPDATLANPGFVLAGTR